MQTISIQESIRKKEVSQSALIAANQNSEMIKESKSDRGGYNTGSNRLNNDNNNNNNQ